MMDHINSLRGTRVEVYVNDSTVVLSGILHRKTDTLYEVLSDRYDNTTAHGFFDARTVIAIDDSGEYPILHAEE